MRIKNEKVFMIYSPSSGLLYYTCSKTRKKSWEQYCIGGYDIVRAKRQGYKCIPVIISYKTS